MRRTFGRAVLCAAALWVALAAIAPAALRPLSPAAFSRPPVNGNRAAVAKIVSVLAGRSAEAKALAKAAEKLTAISDRELRLILSLCDRIEADRGTAGADLAFSLVTALIVLS